MKRHLPFLLWCGAWLTIFPAMLLILGGIYALIPFAYDWAFFRHHLDCCLLLGLAVILVIGMIRSWLKKSLDCYPVPWWQWLILGLELCLVLPVWGTTLWLWIDSDFRNRGARMLLEVQNVPFTPEQLAAKYPQPPGNADDIYRQLMEIDYSGISAGSELAPIPPYTDEVGSRLRQLKPACELLDRLGPESICTFRHDWSAGNAMLLPEIAEIRRLCQLTGLRLSRALARHDATEAVRLWEQLSTFATWLRLDPALSNRFLNLNELQLRILEQMLSYRDLSFSDAQLHSLIDTCFQRESTLQTEYRTDLDGENVFLEAMYRNVDQEQNTYFSFEYHERPPWLPGQPFRQWNQARARQVLGQLKSLSQSEFFAGADAYRHLQEIVGLTPPTLATGLMQTQMLMPLIEYREMNRTMAQLRVARCALAAELYRRKYGRRPTRSADLAPEFLPSQPHDPFTGKGLHFAEGNFDFPLPQEEQDRYRGMAGDRPYPTRNVFRIYSIGADGEDNGGNVYRPDGARNRADDIVFSFYEGDLTTNTSEDILLQKQGEQP